MPTPEALKPYGFRLAQAVAAKLESGEFDGLYYSHRDDCGMGLFMNPREKGFSVGPAQNQDVFVYGSVLDGRRVDVVKGFETRTQFIEWLAQQTDWSLNNCHNWPDEYFCNNQSITRERLEEFVKRVRPPSSHLGPQGFMEGPWESF